MTEFRRDRRAVVNVAEFRRNHKRRRGYDVSLVVHLRRSLRMSLGRISARICELAMIMHLRGPARWP
jgi:hypothetical protein